MANLSIVAVNGLRHIFVLVNITTTDGSNGLKNIVNAYEALIDLSRLLHLNRLSRHWPTVCTLKLMVALIIEVQLFPSQVAYLGLFLVGNMDTLVVNSGCPGVYTLTYAIDQYCWSILDSQHWRYHLMLENTQRLMTDFLSRSILMKATRDSITEYDL